MGKAIFYIIQIVSLVLAIKYDYGFPDYILLLFTCVLSLHFFKGLKNIKDNVIVLFIIIYILLSIHIVALFELSSPGFAKDFITDREYAYLAVWGNRLFFITFLSIYICEIFSKRSKNSTYDITVNKEKSYEHTFFILTIVVYVLAVVSKVLGISDMMEGAKVVLPFHLNGLIDELRANVYPFVFAIYVFDCKIKRRNISRNMFIMFFVYVILEIFVRSSKGALLFSFLPVFELLAFMGLISKKLVVKYVAPLLLVFLLVYPIIETARLGGSISTDSLQQAAKTNKSEEIETHSSPYIRAFLTGVYYTKVIDIVTDNQFEFDLRRVPILLSMDYGGISYMTEVIDGFAPGSGQSSGVTGLCDALLWGGYPLCYLFLFTLVALAYWGDHKGFMQKTPLYRVILFYWIYRLTTGRSISFISDTFFFATMGSTIIKYYLTRMYYKKYI